jgi:hypothetical protein
MAALGRGKGEAVAASARAYKASARDSGTGANTLLLSAVACSWFWTTPVASMIILRKSCAERPVDGTASSMSFICGSMSPPSLAR